MIGKWCPELSDPASRTVRSRARLQEEAALGCYHANHALGGAVKKKGKKKKSVKQTLPKWVSRHQREWENVEFAKDRPFYKRQLQRNPYFQVITPRSQECLLLELCRNSKRDEQRPLVFDIQSNTGRVPKGSAFC